MSSPYKTLVLLSLLLSIAIAAMYVRTGAQVLTPRPEELRFQVLVNQPIAAADRRSILPATSALVVKDRSTGQCFVAVTIGNSMGLSPASCEQ